MLRQSERKMAIGNRLPRGRIAQRREQLFTGLCLTFT